MHYETEGKRYEALCRKLGFLPGAKFVTLRDDGTIGFTVGKPAEIKSLVMRACKIGEPIEKDAMMTYEMMTGHIPLGYRKEGNRYIPQPAMH